MTDETEAWPDEPTHFGLIFNDNEQNEQDVQKFRILKNETSKIFSTKTTFQNGFFCFLTFCLHALPLNSGNSLSWNPK